MFSCNSCPMTNRYAESDVVVSQAGYNTICELLSFSRRAILVPRSEPVREQLIRARLGILAMAAELRNTAKACKLAGVSRSQFYAMRKAYELYGKEGLAPRVRRKPEMPNRTPVQLEEQILLQTRRYPRISYVRLAGEMRSEGGNVTPTMCPLSSRIQLKR